MERTLQKAQPVPPSQRPIESPSANDGGNGEVTLLKHICWAAERGNYDYAVSLSSLDSHDNPVIANARGVCLMRLGRISEALDLFRWLVMNPGCTWVRKDVPEYFVTNFATVLLLAGHPDNCLSVLREAKSDSPVAERLLRLFETWEASLTFKQKLNWWVNRTVPADHPIALDFVPGEFGPPYHDALTQPDQAAVGHE